MQLTKPINQVHENQRMGLIGEYCETTDVVILT
jgi:hypothetical protein